jgi:hypothetical protein
MDGERVTWPPPIQWWKVGGKPEDIDVDDGETFDQLFAFLERAKNRRGGDAND